MQHQSHDYNYRLIIINYRVNFKKYAKPPMTLDHLKSSSVYKLIHDEEEPVHGVQARAGVVLAESDYREVCTQLYT